MRKRLGLQGGCVMVCAAVGFGAERVDMKKEQVSDREEILGHIHGIFRAYLRQDREAIRRMHTTDWVGFQGPSTKIERGLDDYMKNAESSLSHLRGTGYELLDVETQIHGDLALVYYVARYDYVDKEGRAGSLPLRSIDVYRRADGGWNQCGSHITPVPSTGAVWGGGSSKPGSTTATPAPAQPMLAPISPSGTRSDEPVSSLSDAERAELLKARERVWRAWFAGDESSLRAALPEGSFALDPGVAEWADRDGILARSAAFASGGGKLIRLEFPETRIQSFGDVAVIYTRFLFEVDRDGARETVTGRGTEIFVRREGRWLNPGWHLDRGP